MHPDGTHIGSSVVADRNSLAPRNVPWVAAFAAMTNGRERAGDQILLSPRSG
jgi:hypothetical protein